MFFNNLLNLIYVALMVKWNIGNVSAIPEKITYLPRVLTHPVWFQYRVSGEVELHTGGGVNKSEGINAGKFGLNS